ncbi:MAG: HPr family phosphocarrier protein [Coprococcus sp.]
MMNTTDVKVKLDSVDEVQRFVDTMRSYEGDVDVFAANKNYVVDGKSILGVVSLGLEHDLTVRLYDGISSAFMDSLQPFLAAA